MPGTDDRDSPWTATQAPPLQTDSPTDDEWPNNQNSWDFGVQAGVTGAVVALAWVTWGLCPAISVVVACIAAAAVVREPRLLISMALGSPLGLLSTCGGVAGVAQYVGQPAEKCTYINCGNLDPSLRIYYPVSPCMVTFNGITILTAAHATITMTARVFGPPAGAYIGPYPSKEAALDALIADPERLVISDNGATVTVAGHSVVLAPEAREVIQRGFMEATGTVYQERVLMVANLPTIYLIDVETGRYFAEYWYEGETRLSHVVMRPIVSK